MKNLITLLLGIFLSASISFAQNTPTFKQNEGKSKRTQILHALAGSSQSTFNQKTIINNNIESITYQVSTDSAWQSMSRDLFSYNIQNNYFENLYQIYGAESWDTLNKTELYLTNNGLPSNIYEYDFDGDEFFESSATTFYYSSTNKLDSVVFVENYMEGANKEITSFNYISPDSIEFTEEWHYNGSLTSTYYGTVVYRNNNTIITYEDYRDTYFDLSIENFIKDDLSYLAFNSYLFEVRDTLNQWIPLERITYEKENGKLISGKFEYNVEGTWMIQTKNSFNYENDRLVSVIDSSIYGEYTEVYRQLITYFESVGIEEELDNPNFLLHQNYPNPFNPTTNISYTLNSPQKVTLNVYNTLGQKVAQLVNGIQSSGTHSISFNASNLPTGIYIYRLQSGEYTSSKKLVLVK